MNTNYENQGMSMIQTSARVPLSQDGDNDRHNYNINYQILQNQYSADKTPPLKDNTAPTHQLLNSAPLQSKYPAHLENVTNAHHFETNYSNLL